MKAVTYQGQNQVQVKQVDDAKLEKSDVIVKLQLLFAVLIYLYQEHATTRIYLVEPMGIVEGEPDVTKIEKKTCCDPLARCLWTLFPIANTKWKVNVITRTLITIGVVIPRNLVIIRADKLNI